MATAENKANSTDTVTVGCKLPHGLHLDIYNADAKTPEERATVIARHTINGQNSQEIVGGHGITLGVPKAHFEQWMALNKNSAAVRNGLIFAHENAQSAVREAQEKKDTKSGFEGIDPAKPGPGVERAPENDAHKK